jgi:hypothetical protein
LITTGGRDGWLSDASGIARLAFITLCDDVGVGGYIFVAFSWMYVSKREITSLTLSLIFATFASIVAIALSSCCVDFGGVCVVAASSSVRCLFLASRLITCVPRDFTRFYSAYANDRAVEPYRAVVAASLSRAAYRACSFLSVWSASAYSLHFVVN